MQDWLFIKIGIRFEVCHLPYGVKIGVTLEEVTPFNENMHRAIEAAKSVLNIVVENMRQIPQHYPVNRYCGEPEELCEIADARESFARYLYDAAETLLSMM